MVGLRHLATLVANPGVEIPALALTDPEGVATASSSPQPVVDDEALRQYRARLRDLRVRIDEAEELGQHDRVAALRSESAWLLHEVRTSTGLGGRPRQFADGGERARVAVGKAIRRAVDRIYAADTVIGEELRACVETGAVCRYQPVDVDELRPPP
jgi:hypothetical protein